MSIQMCKADDIESKGVTMKEYTTLEEIRLPSVVAWQPFPLAPDTTDRQVVWLRGTDLLQYGFRKSSDHDWTVTRIDRPERFGFERTLETARVAAKRFFGVGL